MPTKKALRQVCRARWGKNWHCVHPAIKKARMTWAMGGDPEGRRVVVTDESGSYTA
jgi:hypothetical protein